MKPILMAEDYSDDAELMRQVLVKAGVANPIVVVRDGDEAIAYLNGEEPFADREKFPTPGILLLDLKMPGKGGFEVLEWIRCQARLKDLLIVVMSGHHEVWEVGRAYALGAKSFIFKPANSAEIAQLVKAHPAHWTTVNAPPLQPPGQPPQDARA